MRVTTKPGIPVLVFDDMASDAAMNWTYTAASRHIDAFENMDSQ